MLRDVVVVAAVCSHVPTGHAASGQSDDPVLPSEGSPKYLGLPHVLFLWLDGGRKGQSAIRYSMKPLTVVRRRPCSAPVQTILENEGSVSCHGLIAFTKRQEWPHRARQLQELVSSHCCRETDAQVALVFAVVAVVVVTEAFAERKRRQRALMARHVSTKKVQNRTIDGYENVNHFHSSVILHPKLLIDLPAVRRKLQR